MCSIWGLYRNQCWCRGLLGRCSKRSWYRNRCWCRRVGSRCRCWCGCPLWHPLMFHQGICSFDHVKPSKLEQREWFRTTAQNSYQKIWVEKSYILYIWKCLQLCKQLRISARLSFWSSARRPSSDRSQKQTFSNHVHTNMWWPASCRHTPHRPCRCSSICHCHA